MTKSKPSREEIARREIGFTSISRGASLFLSVCFLFTIFTVPIIQLIIDGFDSKRAPFVSVAAGQEELWVSRAKSANKEILRKIDLLESDIEEGSFLRALFLPSLQYIFTKYLGQGNEKVISGRKGQLFYRPAVTIWLARCFWTRGSKGHVRRDMRYGNSRCSRTR